MIAIEDLDSCRVRHISKWATFAYMLGGHVVTQIPRRHLKLVNQGLDSFNWSGSVRQMTGDKKEAVNVLIESRSPTAEHLGFLFLMQLYLKLY